MYTFHVLLLSSTLKYLSAFKTLDGRTRAVYINKFVEVDEFKHAYLLLLTKQS